MKPHKRTRIVCTIGPASHSVSKLKQMIRAGMNVCRLNFSHGTHPDHRQLIKNIQRAASETSTTVSILQDLSGPKMRVGDMSSGGEEGVLLKNGEMVTFSSKSRKGVLHVQYPYLERDVKKGERILLDDGTLEVEVVGVRKTGLTCKVIIGGLLKSHKGLNLPGSKLSISAITEKDKKDLAFGLKQGVDFVALSSVRSAREINRLRKMIDEQWVKSKGLPPKIIAKIEKPEALEDIDKIVKAVDGIMVARGDLGIETPAARVPVAQKQIVALCRQAGKPVIVATEMLASMVDRPRPTRAEVSDVANAVIDHTDAVMLSGESATGAYPVQAVAIMANVARETEASLYDDVGVCQTGELSRKTHRMVGSLISVLAERGDVSAVLIPPEAANLVSQIAFFRPEVPVIVGSDDERMLRQLNAYWGVYALPTKVSTPASFMRVVSEHAKKLGIRKVGQVAMIHGGSKMFDLFVGPLKSIG